MNESDLDAIEGLREEGMDLAEAQDYAAFDWILSANTKMAALIAEVRRLREEAGGAWEYGIRTTSFINTVYDWTPWTREEVIAECKRRNDHDGRVGYSMKSVPFRRKAAGEPEALA